MNTMQVELNEISGVVPAYKITPEQLEKVRVRGIPPGSAFVIETDKNLTMLPVNGDGKAIGNGQDVTGPLLELVARDNAQLWAPMDSLTPERWKDLDELEKARLLGFTVIRNPSNGAVSLTKPTQTMGIVTVSYHEHTVETSLVDGSVSVFSWNNPFGAKYSAPQIISVDRKINRTDNWAISEGTKLLQEQREKVNAPLPANVDEAMTCMGWEIVHYTEHAGEKFQGKVCYYAKLIGTQIVKIYATWYGNAVAWSLNGENRDYYATPMEVVAAMETQTAAKETDSTLDATNSHEYVVDYDEVGANVVKKLMTIQGAEDTLKNILWHYRTGGKSNTIRDALDFASHREIERIRIQNDLNNAFRFIKVVPVIVP